MSILKTGKVQIGSSGLSTENFHWRNLLDGLLRLCRGDAEEVSPTEVMVVNADNSVSFPWNVASGVLGAGQTWQDVTASRSVGTTYTNTTGKPIAVACSISSSGTTAASITVNGVVVCDYVAANANSLFAIVPHGATYLLSATAVSSFRFKELR